MAGGMEQGRGIVDRTHDYDWLVIGSGFGGSVAALRLAEKGYRVGLLEQGRRITAADLPASASDIDRFVWNPQAGKFGIMRRTVFDHIAFNAQVGLGGGSLVYGGVLYRAKRQFFEAAQWAGLGDWESRLQPHYETAERMLGVQPVPFASVHQQMIRDMAAHFGVPDGVQRAPVGAFFGPPGKTVPDPYFGGEGPERTGCTRCGSCMVGCRIGAVNSLGRNYLWFAERLGVAALVERRVTDVAPLGAPDGSDGYRVTSQHADPAREDPQVLTAGGVVFAAGTLGTNHLLANCRAGGSLPRLSPRLGKLVRTNSESILTVLLPEDRETWRDVTVSSSVHVDADTHIELLTYGPNADALAKNYTVLVGPGGRFTRRLRWLANLALHPLQWARTRRPKDWSRRMILLLAMQSLDNGLMFRSRPRRDGKGHELFTAADPDRPSPSYIPQAHRAARWLARHTGGIAQSSRLEARSNIPTTAHMLGGAVIGADASRGVVDPEMKVFGYHNMIVCDAAAMPANPGVNPALTITALAEYAMSHIAPRATGKDQDR